MSLVQCKCKSLCNDGVKKAFNSDKSRRTIRSNIEVFMLITDNYPMQSIQITMSFTGI